MARTRFLVTSIIGVLLFLAAAGMILVNFSTAPTNAAALLAVLCIVLMLVPVYRFYKLDDEPKHSIRGLPLVLLCLAASLMFSVIAYNDPRKNDWPTSSSTKASPATTIPVPTPSAVPTFVRPDSAQSVQQPDSSASQPSTPTKSVPPATQPPRTTPPKQRVTKTVAPPPVEQPQPPAEEPPVQTEEPPAEEPCGQQCVSEGTVGVPPS